MRLMVRKTRPMVSKTRLMVSKTRLMMSKTRLMVSKARQSSERARIKGPEIIVIYYGCDNIAKLSPSFKSSLTWGLG